MPGPPPKDPATRQRRNAPATKAFLPPDGRRRARVPRLPERAPASDDAPGERPWHALTRLWWRALWRSPMSARFLRVEVYELLVVAQLRDDFHYCTDAKERQAIAGELRLQAARWGLDQIARWRLGWEVPSDLPAPKGAVATAAETPAAAPPEQLEDRRNVLSMLKGGKSA